MLITNRILLIFAFLPFIFSSCVYPERHRIYFPQSTDELYRHSDDIDNPVFDKYTVNGTKFILLSEMYWYQADWRDLRDDMSGCKFLLRIYTKEKDTITYRILKATIDTTSFSMDIDINKLDENEVVFYPSNAARQDGYKVKTILSHTYRFPRPKDMKYSITVLIEEEKDNGEKNQYEFVYYFFLKKKDRWFDMIGV